MPRAKNNSDKQKALQQHGTLNPRPQDVRHPLFQGNEFFDPSDLLQVKYEMLRQVHVDKRAVSRTAPEFGFSRPSFYQAEFAFEQGGLPIISPEAWSEKRTQAHSGSDEVRGRATSPGAITEFRSAGRTGAAQLPRESARPQHRAAASAEKKTPISLLSAHTAAPLEKDGWLTAYEELRLQLLNGQRGTGLALFMRRGMREWMTVCSPCLGPPPTKEFAATDEAALPQGARTEVVLILAGMLLHGCQERVS